MPCVSHEQVRAFEQTGAGSASQETKCLCVMP